MTLAPEDRAPDWNAPDGKPPDWEAFYRDYRKPGYVPGFEITTKLGGGMFGLVFRARRMSIGKDYAIKFLQVDDGEVRKAVLGELEQVKYFAQIDHPNLVSIEDRAEVDGIPYLVMAFAGTETLRDKIVQKQVPSGEAKDELVRWFLQACRGLAALHERSLVHFDVKPANVFLKGGVARLGDYGLSKLVTHSRGSLSMGRGTPYYMAPEMLQRRGDHRSDVYSAGVVLYEILCAEMPFTGDSEWEVLRKHETQPPALPDHLTPRERAVLQRCLAKDPAARFQSVHDLIAALAGEQHADFAPVAAAGAAERAAAAAADTMLGCVPPPLPAPATASLLRGRKARRRATTPPPLPRGKRRSGRAPGVAIFLAIAVAVVLTLSREGRRGSMEMWPSQARAAASTRATVDPGPASKCDQLVATVLRDARDAERRGRRPELREVEPSAFGMPRDFAIYRAEVAALANERGYSAGHARKLEHLGRPAFVAGIAMLHDYDYEDREDCARAANVQRFLCQMTAIDNLVIALDGREPDAGDTCKLLVLADGWRRIGEQFAKDDATFQGLLTARKKSVDR